MAVDVDEWVRLRCSGCGTEARGRPNRDPSAPDDAPPDLPPGWHYLLDGSGPRPVCSATCAELVIMRARLSPVP